MMITLTIARLAQAKQLPESLLRSLGLREKSDGVAIPYLDENGNPIDPPDLVPLGKDGWSSDHRLQLDAKRTWITVRSLLGSTPNDVESGDYPSITVPLPQIRKSPAIGVWVGG